MQEIIVIGRIYKYVHAIACKPRERDQRQRREAQLTRRTYERMYVPLSSDCYFSQRTYDRMYVRIEHKIRLKNSLWILSLNALRKSLKTEQSKDYLICLEAVDLFFYLLSVAPYTTTY